MTKDNPALDALLPCPFCGGADLEIANGMGEHWVLCKNNKCEANGYLSSSKQGAISAWNTRPQPCGDAVMALDAFNWLKSMGMISFNDTGFNKGASATAYHENLKQVEDFLNGR